MVAHGLYWAGNGVGASALLEEAAGRGHRLAELLLAMLRRGLPYRGQ